MVSNIKCIVFVIKRDKTKPIKFDPIMKKNMINEAFNMRLGWFKLNDIKPPDTL